jgi:hypothetical protein
MSRNYKFASPVRLSSRVIIPEKLYFVSFAVVGWLEVSTRNEYKDLLL